jgi:hypothetical protein
MADKQKKAVNLTKAQVISILLLERDERAAALGVKFIEAITETVERTHGIYAMHCPISDAAQDDPTHFLF